LQQSHENVSKSLHEPWQNEETRIELLHLGIDNRGLVRNRHSEWRRLADMPMKTVWTHEGFWGLPFVKKAM